MFAVAVVAGAADSETEPEDLLDNARLSFPDEGNHGVVGHLRISLF